MSEDSSTTGAKKLVEVRHRVRSWEPYIEAELGFRNHWYPAFFSNELPEADVSRALGEGSVRNVRVLTMLGERILFRRVDGRVYALEDQCLHKGSPFSVKPECYTKSTITCWYHGFTYDVRDGRLKTIITDPKSPLIGKAGIKSYPVEEHKGLVFVFVGDIGPPPLQDDLQPGFLDDSLTICPNGWTDLVASNWRLAVENGFDPAHIYLHRNAGLVRAFRLPTVLGDTGLAEGSTFRVVDGPGPKGVLLIRGTGEAVWETEIEPGVKIKARFRPGVDGVTAEMVPEVGAWMPCGIKVDPFPAPKTIHFEWFVPVDENHHRYLMTWGRVVQSAAEQARFFEEVETIWKPLVPTTFNNDDVMAREAVNEFYSSQDGWHCELRGFGPDVVVNTWREFASRVNRGIQRHNAKKA